MHGADDVTAQFSAEIVDIGIHRALTVLRVEHGRQQFRAGEDLGRPSCQNFQQRSLFAREINDIRTAAVSTDIPCITTIQGLGAAVQGLEAMRRGDIGVRSLQDWAIHLRAGASAAVAPAE